MDDVEHAAAQFEQLARSWAATACETFGYPPVDEEWAQRLQQRLPMGVRALVVQAHAHGVVESEGFRFTLPDLDPGKGPYAWLSRDTAAQQPAVNWEYFVQVAEYARLRTLAGARGFRVGFEDELVDVTVRDGASLLLAVEVKETAAALNQLETELHRHATGVDLDADDRHQDGLRKAKYLLEHQPAFFALAAIGSRREFSVTLQGSNRFALDEDVVPL